MKKIFSFLFSFSFMGFMLLIFAFSMAVATFIESSYGTEAAKGFIYNSKWFELILLLLAINLSVNFVRHKMYLKNRISVGVFHVSFVIILLGAAVTRYISYEGVMQIREGETTDYIISSDDYFTIKTDDGNISRKVLFSELTSGQLDERINVDGHKIRIKSIGFIKDAKRNPVPHSSGTELIDFVVSQGQGMESFTFRKGENVAFDNVNIGFESSNSNISFFSKGEKLFICSDREIELRSMTGGTQEIIAAGDTAEVQQMHLYAFGRNLLLVKNFYERAILRVTRDHSGNSQEDAVIVQLSDGENQQVVNVFGRHGLLGKEQSVEVGNSKMLMSYGAKKIPLSFALRLKDFQLEKYPGSESPSSFASEIELIDEHKNIKKDVRIFMNNTLTYDGYKFFQSSYHQDEKGTVLSVNADRAGTTITYIGYFLLFLGIVWSLLNRNSYFYSLVKRLKNSRNISLIVLAFLLMVSGQVKAGESDIAGVPKLDKELVNDFSRLWVQGRDGRIEPVSTLASEVLRKVSRKSNFYGRSPEEVILGMYLYPELWRTVPLVKISNEEVKAILGTNESRVPLTQFFDDNGNYKLADKVRLAFQKIPAFRNKTEKEFINADERLNICFMVINGDLFSIFPSSDKNSPWLSPGDHPSGIPSADSLFVNRGFELLKEEVNGNGEIHPGQILATIAAYQEKFGGGLIPSAGKKKAEIVYNQANPFKRIFPIYLMLGFILLTVLLVYIFKQKPIHRKLKIGFQSLIALTFLVHTVGLIIRWYISGHAPWSNGYESMLYVAWAAMLAGIIFGRKYPMVTGTAAVLSGIILFVAHLNWMNPEITNLVPVLKSYWLLIHVAIITASYGFIGLSAFLGILVLILYALSREKNVISVKPIINQLTTINEMAAIVGLYMLAIGTFLGGVWANESWGRYWGWDPKETWALISVVVYSFIGHMRLIPSMKGTYNYNLASVIGFASILMTYFGVNYYLSGLHSYGKGSAGSINWGVYLSIIVLLVIIIVSNLKQKKLYGKS